MLLTAEEMDKMDDAMRDTIKKLWPIHGKKLHAIMVPPNEGILHIEMFANI